MHRRRQRSAMSKTDRNMVFRAANRLDRLALRVTDPTIKSQLSEIVDLLDNIHDSTAIHINPAHLID